jgi:hypothetical protein
MSGFILQQMRQRRVAPAGRPGLWHYGCNLCAWRHLVKRIAGCGLAAFFILLTLFALFTRQHVTYSHPTRSLSGIEPAPAPGSGSVEADLETAEADGIIDLHGNEVSPAVATYSFDALGSLYEVHSPQTELPRLGSPKT